MTIEFPEPSPAGGFRRLSAREAAQRARAMDCIRDRNPTKCKGQVFTSIFFDGTGNNAGWRANGESATQQVANKHSNIARLRDAALNEPTDGFFRSYVPGVGTPFPEIGDSGGAFGMGFGRFGSDRINWALIQVLNASHRYLTGGDLIPDSEAKTIVRNISSTWRTMGLEGPNRRWVLRTWRERLKQVVDANQRKLLQINVAVFGFSRGAATARAFAHWLAQICQAEEDGYTMAGVPIRLYFMGIYDTVASVGIPDAIPGFDGHMAWADGTMAIHPMVEQCVHFIALHEQRASFPLEHANMGKQMAYPGMHSDVGGGYKPGEQGKAMPDWGDSPHLSQIPLLDMHHHVLRGGVPIKTADEIRQEEGLAESFAVSEKTRTAFNAWLTGHGQVTSGTAERITESHAQQYQRYRGLRLNGAAAVETSAFFARANGADQALLRSANLDLRQQIDRLKWRRDERARQEASGIAGLVDNGMYSPYGLGATADMPQPVRPLSAFQRTVLDRIENPGQLPQAVLDLFDDFVHDSRAGFRPVGSMMEPSGEEKGYLRYRTVFNPS